MTDGTSENLLADMVQDFLRNAGGDDAVSALCRKLLAEQEQGSVCLPVTPEEQSLLANSPLVSLAPDDRRPFILNAEKRLFCTRRNWKYEQLIRQRIKAMAEYPGNRAVTVPDDGDFAQLKECQRQAIRMIAERQFSILTGGPGTGKTYTISRAVRLIREQFPEIREIGLAAPTGKAAARVRETMADDSMEAATIHTLLEPNYDFVTFRHNAENPLPLDWLIVDEASMIDLPLMAKLLDALKPECKLTLAGDADQLSSVAPGRVFGDLCALPEMQECIAKLTESSRLQNAREVFLLAEAVRTGDADRALELLKQGRAGAIRYCPLNAGGFQEEGASFRESIREGFAEFCRQTTPEGALEKLNACRVLCAVRKGPCGTGNLNAFFLKTFRDCPVPMMITRNDPALGVSNGDVGILMPGDETRLHLPGNGGVRTIPTALLPDLEMAFATTIHKSQGSEFDRVIIVLPPCRESAETTSLPLTRELLYTAITRTRRSVLLFADEPAIRACCLQATRRCTGLR